MSVFLLAFLHLFQTLFKTHFPKARLRSCLTLSENHSKMSVGVHCALIFGVFRPMSPHTSGSCLYVPAAVQATPSLNCEQRSRPETGKKRGSISKVQRFRQVFPFRPVKTYLSPAFLPYPTTHILHIASRLSPSSFGEPPSSRFQRLSGARDSARGLKGSFSTSRLDVTRLDYYQTDKPEIPRRARGPI